MGAGRLSVTLPLTLERLITAICADYERRCEEIVGGRVNVRVEMEYKYMNHRIFEGAAEIVGSELASAYINEIGSRTGYVNSRDPSSSEGRYKSDKKEVKLNIARKLHLI